jgi:hypothetical protein
MKKTITIIVLSFFIFLVGCTPKSNYQNSRVIETPNSINVRTVRGWPNQAWHMATFNNGVRVVAKKGNTTIKVICPKGQVLLVQGSVNAGSIIGKKCNAKDGCIASGVQFILTGGKSNFVAYNKTIQTGVTVEDLNAWILGPDNGLSAVNCIPKNHINDWTDA